MCNIEKKKLLRDIESGAAFGPQSFEFWYEDLKRMLRWFTRFNDKPADHKDFGLEFVQAYQKAKDSWRPGGQKFGYHLKQSLRYQLLKRWEKESNQYRLPTINECDIYTDNDTRDGHFAAQSKNIPTSNLIDVLSKLNLSERELRLLKYKLSPTKPKEIARKMELHYMSIVNSIWPRVRNKIQMQLEGE